MVWCHLLTRHLVKSHHSSPFPWLLISQCPLQWGTPLGHHSLHPPTLIPQSPSPFWSQFPFLFESWEPVNSNGSLGFWFARLLVMPTIVFVYHSSPSWGGKSQLSGITSQVGNEWSLIQLKRWYECLWCFCSGEKQQKIPLFQSDPKMHFYRYEAFFFPDAAWQYLNTA